MNHPRYRPGLRVLPNGWEITTDESWCDKLTFNVKRYVQNMPYQNTGIPYFGVNDDLPINCPQQNRFGWLSVEIPKKICTRMPN